jgi:hypothetical protein
MLNKASAGVALMQPHGTAPVDVVPDRYCNLVLPVSDPCVPTQDMGPCDYTGKYKATH